MVTFSNAFTVGDSPEEFLSGTYEVVVEEELLQSLSFEVYRRTATHLIVRGGGNHAGRIEMRKITPEDLEHAIARDRILSETIQHSEAALSPLEDTT